MIEKYKLESMISKLSNLTRLVIIRNDQMAKKPKYPYVSYKLINTNEEAAISNILEKSNTENIESIFSYSENTISFQVYSDIYDIALIECNNLFTKLKSIQILENGKLNNYSISLGLTAITDRTIVLDADYEYRFGFDIIIKTQTETKENIEIINTIQGTIEGISPDDSSEIQAIEVTR